MGAITADAINEAVYFSGASLLATNPSALHRFMSTAELSDLQSVFYRGSGGSASSLIGVTPSGTLMHVAAAIDHQNGISRAIANLAATFQLTKEELAHVLGVQSRKTLYNWINGSATPRKSTQDRLYELVSVASAWEHLGISVGRAQLHESIVDGESVIGLLEKPVVERDLILFAGSRLSMTSTHAPRLSDPFA